MIKELSTRELIENVQQGVTVFDGALELVACNANFRKMMDFPENFCEPGTPLIDFLRFNAQLGVYGSGNVDELAQQFMMKMKADKQYSYERELANGSIINIQGNYTNDGWFITTFTDVTVMRVAARDNKDLNQILDKKNQLQAGKLKLAKLELSERNKTLEAIIENTKHGMSLFDQDLILVACNKRFLELMALPEDLGDPGTGLEEFFRYNAKRGEYGKGNIEEQVAERLALAKKFEAHKFERVRPNGTVLEIIGTPIALGFVTTYTDITELRQTQNELEEATQNLQEKVGIQTRELRQKEKRSQQLISAFDTLRESIAILDQEDRFVFTNKRYREINQSVIDHIAPGCLFEDYLHALITAELVPNTEGRKTDWVRDRMKQHRNPIKPFEVRRQSGIWLLVNEQKLQQGGTIMFATDITERKLAEEALKESEELFRATAENLREVFWITNQDETGNHKFQYVNPAFEQIWQRKRTDLYEDNAVWFDCMHPDDKKRVHAAAEAFFYDRESYKEEFRIITPDGTEKNIQVTGNLIIDNNDTVVRAAGVARDITEHKQLEEQIRRTQKMDAVGQLTGGIAHDFNNILGIIQGNMELLASLVSDNEEALQRIKMACKGVDRGIDITKKLLFFASKDSQKTNVISVNNYIENLENLIARSLTASIKVETQLSENLWPVAIDPGDFEDAILNLSLNARDAMAEGGTLVIETANKVLDEDYVKRNPTSKAGEFVMISISDTGEGMPDEVKDKIFEPFFTTKEQGKGTGLGLSMVYGFVERSGGHLKVYSELGTGTTFRIYLPRACLAVEIPDKYQNTPIDLPTGSETILIVDDEKALREIAVLHLEKLGYTVLSAKNGKEALQLLEKHIEIDLLFSDVVMPGQLDGYQLAASAHEKYPALKILLTSGFTKSQEERAYAEDAFLAHLTVSKLKKPYNQAELALSLRNVLDATE